jgi:uncharacterized protein (DUF2147 family)
MNSRCWLFAATTVAVLALTIPAARAQEAIGLWTDNEGSSIRVARCGDALCGTLAQLPPDSGAAKVGQRVFFDMKPAGLNKWRGNAFNPEDGRMYTGMIEVSGTSLITSGCILGGWICRSVTWYRSSQT